MQIRKVTYGHIAHDLASIADGLGAPVDELASRAQNNCGASTALPEHRAGFGEVRVVRETNHSARVIQRRANAARKEDIGVNELASGRCQRHRGARATGSECGMTFNEVRVAAVADDLAGSIDYGG